MIKVFYQEDIIYRLAAIITYGINNGYSYKNIEERIVSSYFINELENNKYDIECTIENIVETIYKTKLNKEADISYRGLFIAESYFKLFINYNRSFEYLFLYWPISTFIEKYDVYHEMDFSNLKRDFETLVKQKSLIKKLSTEKQIKLSEISKLTGINKNTIDKYSSSDNYLNGASGETIYKLAKLFDVKENIFIANLAVYLDQTIYLFDKTSDNYRNYLGFYYANFFDSRINEKDFLYDISKQRFVSKDEHTKIMVLSTNSGGIDFNYLQNIIDPSTYLIVFQNAYFKDTTRYDYLKNLNCMEVMVIAQEFIFLVKRNLKKGLTDTINRSLIIRAKESSLNEHNKRGDIPSNI